MVLFFTENPSQSCEVSPAMWERWLAIGSTGCTCLFRRRV